MLLCTDSDGDHSGVCESLRCVKALIAAVDSKVNEQEKKRRLKEVHRYTHPHTDPHPNCTLTLESRPVSDPDSAQNLQYFQTGQDLHWSLGVRTLKIVSFQCQETDLSTVEGL